RPSPPLSDVISRFPRRLRMALLAWGQSSPKARDIMVAFPYAAASIAARRGLPQNRGEAMWRIEEGRTLKAVAEALDIPAWTRRIPPESSDFGLPDRLGFEEPEDGLHTQLAKRLPAKPGPARRWLAGLSNVGARSDWAFAMDYADGLATGRMPVHPCPRLWCAFAYFSARPETVAGRRIERPWQPGFSAGRLSEQALDWFCALVETDLTARPAHNLPTTLTLGNCVFKRLTRLRDLRAEALAMRNCIDRYWMKALGGHSLIFGVADTSGRRATLEVRRQRRGSGLYINDIKGPGNQTVDRRLAQAAEIFVSTHAEALAEAFRVIAAPAPTQAWQSIWTPYWGAYGEETGIPLTPGQLEIAALASECR
ncbi:MAG: hypothetical protein AAFQ67_10050, partial [Pseudomonadota bacterium]